MIELKHRGIAASNGVAVGKLKFLKNSVEKIPTFAVKNTERERERVENAVEEAVSQLKKLYLKAKKSAGAESAEIFSIHEVMLSDPDFNDFIKEKIESEHINAESAVELAAEKFIKELLDTGDEYLMARATDIRDISDRIIKILLGKKDETLSFDGEYIIYIDDLTPSEALQLDKEKILAVITAYGSKNSHTAILARTRGIPCIVGVGELPQDYDGREAIIDGGSGGYEIDPPNETVINYKKIMEDEKKRKNELLRLKGVPTVTSEGKKLLLYANIGSKHDLESVIKNDAEGIGLFRTEFIFLERSSLPSEEEQFIIYSEIARRMEGKRVIIRTLDIGADKHADYLKLPMEENPALGARGIRLCLERPEIFHTQLRAILRASAFGKISVMFPMISSLFEIKEAKKLLKEVKDELEREKNSFDRSIEVGMMIETPSAAVLSEEFASEVDFFSIGTNDLTQYTLAADRQNPGVSRYYRHDHESVMLLIKTVCKNAHKAGIWVGVCGELAADLSVTKKLVFMGVDELSVSPPMILPLREKIRGL